MPSSSTSTSARNTIPAFVSAGTRSAGTIPRGSRAPAARQVHVPSPRSLVSSISILRDMADHRSGPLPRRLRGRVGELAELLDGLAEPVGDGPDVGDELGAGDDAEVDMTHVRHHREVQPRAFEERT